MCRQRQRLLTFFFESLDYRARRLTKTVLVEYCKQRDRYSERLRCKVCGCHTVTVSKTQEGKGARSRKGERYEEGA